MMTDNRSALGGRVYGLGIIALAVTCLIFGDFNGGQPVPKAFPARAELAYAMGIFLLACGWGSSGARPLLGLLALSLLTTAYSS
jgi:hypothetical protein